MKLPIEESVVKLLPSAGSLCYLYYLTPFARSSDYDSLGKTRYTERISKFEGHSG